MKTANDTYNMFKFASVHMLCMYCGSTSKPIYVMPWLKEKHSKILNKCTRRAGHVHEFD